MNATNPVNRVNGYYPSPQQPKPKPDPDYLLPLIDPGNFIGRTAFWIALAALGLAVIACSKAYSADPSTAATAAIDAGWDGAVIYCRDPQALQAGQSGCIHCVGLLQAIHRDFAGVRVGFKKYDYRGRSNHFVLRQLPAGLTGEPHTVIFRDGRPVHWERGYNGSTDWVWKHPKLSNPNSLPLPLDLIADDTRRDRDRSRGNSPQKDGGSTVPVAVVRDASGLPMAPPSEDWTLADFAPPFDSPAVSHDRRAVQAEPAVSQTKPRAMPPVQRTQLTVSGGVGVNANLGASLTLPFGGASPALWGPRYGRRFGWPVFAPVRYVPPVQFVRYAPPVQYVAAPVQTAIQPSYAGAFSTGCGGGGGGFETFSSPLSGCGGGAFSAMSAASGCGGGAGTFAMPAYAAGFGAGSGY